VGGSGGWGWGGVGEAMLPALGCSITVLVFPSLTVWPMSCGSLRPNQHECYLYIYKHRVYREQYIDQTYTQVGYSTHAGHTCTPTLFSHAFKGTDNQSSQGKFLGAASTRQQA